jgi:hypothetical protein
MMEICKKMYLKKKHVLLSMIGAASGGGKLHESWEFDSGARDLSPEPHTLQKLVEAAGGSLLTSGATGNMLDLANKVRDPCTLRSKASSVETKVRREWSRTFTGRSKSHCFTFTYKRLECFQCRSFLFKGWKRHSFHSF